ncbi:hypothetical protein FOA52_005730 [Chlamydomonas sp. UWO 241]|nr:hypothetical protein FOA52_005730 [Chlamydomonas sp. UWO 241]
MIVDKVPWVNHDGCPIFAIDVDATGSRVATCGQDNKVRIWNAQAMLIEAKELDTSVPRCLATLADTGAINIARFSRTGSLLATGSDAQIVCIYELRAGPARAMFGVSDTANLENWTQVRQLCGHKNNIVDLAWSPDGRSLASASLDNLVIIWDVASGHRVHTIDAHQGFVKGVAWDPFNMYLATQGENDGVYVWRVGDWERPVAHFEEGVTTNPTAGFHSRLGWSPDGQLLAATNGYHQPKHLSPIVARSDWKSSYSLVGHANSVVVAKFSPVFVHPRNSSDPDELTTIVALGSTDKRFTVWLHGEPQPVTCGSKFFKAGITDIAWSPDGNALFACSYDGTVATVQFKEGELGRRASPAKVEALISRLYAGNTHGNAGGNLTPSLAIAQLRAGGAGAAHARGIPGGPPPAASAALAARLQPAGTTTTLLRAPPPAGDATVAGGGGSGSAAGSVTGAAPGGPRRLTPTPIGATAAAMGTGALGGGGGGSGSGGVAPGPGVGPPLNAPTGASPPAKRARIMPTPTGATAAAAAAPHAAAPAGAPAPAAAAAATLPAAMPSGGGCGGGYGGGSGGGAGPSLLLRPPAVAALVTHSVEAAPSHGLPPPGGEPPSVVTLRVENGRKHDARGCPVAAVRCSRGSVDAWSDLLPGSVVALTGSGHYLAAATNEGELQVYSLAGRRLLPPIQLGSPVAFMASDMPGGRALTQPSKGGRDPGWLLLCVTCDGMLRLWDLCAGKRVLEASCAPLLAGRPGTAFSTVRLSLSGVPVVVTSCGRAYSYHSDLAMWVRLADAGAPPTPHATAGLPFAAAGQQGDLARLAAEAARQQGQQGVTGSAGSRGRAAGPGGTAAAGLAQLATNAGEALQRERSQLEANIACCLALGSPAEYKRWLMTYVRKISADGDTARLREVLDELRDPFVHVGVGGSGGGDTVLGHSRALLVREVMREAARNKANVALVQEMADLDSENELRAQQPRGDPLGPATLSYG